MAVFAFEGVAYFWVIIHQFTVHLNQLCFVGLIFELIRPLPCCRSTVVLFGWRSTTAPVQSAPSVGRAGGKLNPFGWAS